MSVSMPTSLENGRYELGELIGRGGMAEVRIAQDTRLGRVVAVKIMRSDLANDEIFLRRFRREAHSVAQMNNANIVNIYDSGEETIVGEGGITERVPYLVMEYVKGQTLRDIIKANGPLSQRDAEQVMLGVLSALDYSHRMGIIHRDIKPGNIMISEQGIVKVMDFGIARALDDSAATMTQSQGVVGTAQYLSPEQARGETVDMRSDLYSAGCVLYEMLTGRAPFMGDSAVSIAYQHVSEVAQTPSSIVPGLPVMWDQIVAKAMAKDRQNRYSTAAEFRDDILTFMNGGVPVAAAFNPLTDLSNMKARKQAEQTAATEALSPVETTATQPFSPLGYEGEAAGVQTAVKSRTEQANDAKRKKKKKIIIGSIIGALVVILAAVGVLFALNNKKVEMVTVPTFSSTTTEDRAREQLESVGLKMEVMHDADSSEPKGTFTHQTPDGGQKAEKGSKVKVWFSTGPEATTVPNVKGKSQEEARQKLTKAGFRVTSTAQEEDSADVAQGMVTRTDPKAGSSQSRGSILTLYVSSGKVKVPDVVGQGTDQATQAIQKLGLNASVQQEYSATVPDGQVSRVNPQAGADVDQHSTVTIFISKGQDPSQMSSVPNVVDQKLGDAKRTLTSLGFQVSASNATSENDVVTGMSPSGGNAAKGSTVTLTTRPAQSSGTTGGQNGSGSNGSGSGNGQGSGGTGGSGTGGTNGSTGTNGAKPGTGAAQ